MTLAPGDFKDDYPERAHGDCFYHLRLVKRGQPFAFAEPRLDRQLPIVVADQDREPRAVVADQHVAGDPRVIDSHRAAHASVRGERAVEGDRGVGVDSGGDRRHVLHRVGAQDERPTADLAAQQRRAAVLHRSR